MLQHARDSVGGVYYKIVVFTTVARRVTTLLNQPEWTVDSFPPNHSGPFNIYLYQFDGLCVCMCHL